jgi:hypothetical protein
MGISIEEGAALLISCLQSALAEKKGCLIGRNGSTELTTLYNFEMAPMYANQLAKSLERYSGVFPANLSTLTKWAVQYRKALSAIDEEPIVAGWYQSMASYEYGLLRFTCPKAPIMPLRCLEPYYVSPELRWTNCLAGKRVAVVSSFSKTILNQIPKAKEIWGEYSESLLPSSATWIPIQTGFPPELARGSVEWPAECSSWDLAVQWLEKEVLAVQADVCLIGCGGLGMILGAQLKEKGVACIVMGGAIQVLFGIKGQRWQSHSVISTFWNDAWVWPSEDETPGGNKKIEGGCYWNPNTN